MADRIEKLLKMLPVFLKLSEGVAVSYGLNNPYLRYIITGRRLVKTVHYALESGKQRTDVMIHEFGCITDRTDAPAQFFNLFFGSRRLCAAHHIAQQTTGRAAQIGKATAQGRFIKPETEAVGDGIFEVMAFIDDQTCIFRENAIIAGRV